MTLSIHAAETPSDLQTVRELLREYARHLEGTVGAANLCFTTYERELESLPAPYVKLLLATVDGEPAGCILLKPVAPRPTECEMKRLWVRPQFRGLGLGRKLAEALIVEARSAGYKAMLLDTVPATMPAAHRLYMDLGFEPVPRYNDNTVPDVEFFRLPL